MVKISFVSLYFTTNKLQIVKLSPSRKKAEVFATVDLPEGLIQNHEVKDVKALSEVLSKVWQKLKIKERSVGIVIPEFSTFTKSVNIPKMDMDDVGEAVKWQAEEYIPIDPKEVMLDWKIIGETADEYKVLLVATNGSLLKGYVSSADLAGLYPLVVETPSISLVRAAGESPNPKLIIYFSFEEIIITLSRGSEIMTSSVVEADTTSSGLIMTIGRILRHYEDIAVEKVFVGGMPSSNEIISELSKNFKTPLEKLQIPVGGMNDADKQKYSIPVSLQYKDPQEPESSKTINLLPVDVVTKYRSGRLNTQLSSMMLMTTLILVGCLMALMGTYFYLSQGLSKYANFSGFADANYQKSKTASDEIKKINNLSDRVLKIDSIKIHPQVIMNLVYQKKPANIAIVSYKVDLEKGLVRVTGLSVGREDLLIFKKSLEESGEFQKVSLPLSSFEQGENIEFEMTFIYGKLAAPAAKK